MIPRMLLGLLYLKLLTLIYGSLHS